jgi:hypothetical protein
MNGSIQIELKSQNHPFAYLKPEKERDLEFVPNKKRND